MNNKIIIPLGLILAGALIAGAILYTNYSETPEQENGEVLSLGQAGEKMISFINETILQGQATASLIEVLEENGLYKVKFQVEQEEVEWWITKDGKFIFPQAIDLTENEPEPESEQKDMSVLENLAKCLTEKGMKFYGSINCGWCQKQKELFGEAAQYLPYIECTDEETGQLTVECQEAGISGFPTWELLNGEKSSGYKSLEELSELSGCSIE